MSANESFSWGAESLERSDGRRRGRPRPRNTKAAARMSLLGSRAVAIVIDGLVLVLPVFAFTYALSLVFPHHGFFFHSRGANGSSGFASVQLGLPGALVVCALALSYFFLFEALRGQTIGKRSMGLRVQSAGGGEPGLNAISARTVLRMIDGLALYLVGALIAIVTGSRRRRLGDWLGGTVVVRDDATLAEPRRRPLWQVVAYPLSWLTMVAIAIFALGLGTAAGADEQAISLVQAYVKAREGGDGVLACSMLTREQQRELVAIQTRSYRHPDIARCPSLILGSDPSSHLLNPALADLAAGPIVARYNSAGFASVGSAREPGVELLVTFPEGHPKLDMRGAERLGFLKGCDASGRASSAQCACMFATLRASGMVELAFRGDFTETMREEQRGCLVAAPAKTS
jgi:uncharacterized RDD family membrane protein YckC